VTINLANGTAERWVIQTLSRAGPLWKLAAQRIDFSQGHFASTLPPHTDKAVAERFREEPPKIRSDFPHTSTPERVARVIRPVVDLVLEHLRADERNVTVIGLEEYRRHNLPFDPEGGVLRYSGDSVYHLLRSADARESVVSGSIQGGENPWCAPGLLTEMPEPGRFVEWKTSELGDLVERASKMYLLAYDFWGAVIWTASNGVD